MKYNFYQQSVSFRVLFNQYYKLTYIQKELKGEFQRINTLKFIFPDLHELEDQNLQIWETQAKGPLLRPGKKSRQLDVSQIYGDFWTVVGEQVYFQR